jgi:hypothetical protein
VARLSKPEQKSKVLALLAKESNSILVWYRPHAGAVVHG